MKNILYVEEPPITSYPVIANVLSILWPKKDVVLPWISDHFIQLIMRPNYPYTTADFYDNADIDNYNCLIYNVLF